MVYAWDNITATVFMPCEAKCIVHVVCAYQVHIRCTGIYLSSKCNAHALASQYAYINFKTLPMISGIFDNFLQSSLLPKNGYCTYVATPLNPKPLQLHVYIVLNMSDTRQWHSQWEKGLWGSRAPPPPLCAQLPLTLR